MRIDDSHMPDNSDQGQNELFLQKEAIENERGPEAVADPAAVHFREADASPVFFDERRRRWPWFLRGAVIALLVFTAGAIMLLVSIFALPLMPRSPLPKEAPILDTGNADPTLSIFKGNRNPVLGLKIGMDIKKNEILLKEQESAINLQEAERDRQAEEFLRQTNTVSYGPVPPAVIAGFYVNWEQTSRASLHRHIGALTHVIPEWLHLNPEGSNYSYPCETTRLSWMVAPTRTGTISRPSCARVKCPSFRFSITTPVSGGANPGPVTGIRERFIRSSPALPRVLM